MRVSLAAVTDDCHSPSAETAYIRVSIVKEFGHEDIPSACDHQARVASSGPAALAPRVGPPSAIARLPDRIVSHAPIAMTRAIISPSRSGVSVISTTTVCGELPTIL